MNGRKFLQKSITGLSVFLMTASVWAAGKGPLQIKPPKTFPVVISQPGSYQLIGNLTVPPNGGNAINILANDVTLDLNGFTVQGTNGTPAIGISAGAVNQRNVTIKNGTVRGFSSDGISLSGNGHIVTGVKAEGNGVHGIDVSQGSIIERCTACTKLNAPFRFVFSTTSQSSEVMRMLSMSRVMPALFTRISTRPKSLKICSPILCTSA